MEAMISEEEFRKIISGFSIVDCAVRNKDFLHFMSVNTKEAENADVFSQTTVGKRAIVFMPTRPYGARAGRIHLTGWETMQICGSQHNEDKIVCVEAYANIYAAGGGQAEKEDPIPKGPDGPCRGAIQRVRMIDGMLYAAGGWNTVCRRRGRNDWESLCLNLPVPKSNKFDIEESEIMGLEDIDGFARDDLYVIAGKGVVWHCDGKEWRQLPFPSNMLMLSICCAGDGQVYIGAQSGSLFRGRGDRWDIVERGQMSLPFQDIVWHAGRLWCTSDYGLWTLEKNRIVRADVPSEISVCAGHLSAADGVMLMAGANGAAYHDGDRWHSIFLYHEMAQAMREDLGNKP
ncbi:MAG: hypothetical protein LBF61_03665 [Azoarcus sp.]|jgi:hypothetical protein|nr:hypothetical protein [Azoarcus sp.]